MTRSVVDSVFQRVPLTEIVKSVATLAVLGETTGVDILDVCFDSREVTPGSLFCCLPGGHHDGHAFAEHAFERGALAFLCEHSLGVGLFGATQLVVAPGSIRNAMAKAACTLYANPATSMRTAGVTGTNGKTTTTYLLRSIFERHGWRAGVIGTLDGARTTPESPDLQRSLARQRDAGCKATALEVSSHALVQSRVDGILFDVAIFTNLSQDHLDFHGTMEAYFAAKAKLFTPERCRVAVVNADDEWGRRLIERATVPTVSFSLKDVSDLEIGLNTSRFRLGRHLVRLGLGGEFNVRNALGAAAGARALGVGADEIIAGLEAAPPVPGRFEGFEGAGIIAVVDYAHTPAGLEEVLTSARQALRLLGPTAAGESRPGGTARVIVVFGCGGERDRGKRPAMGAVAARLADAVVLTSDNPRSEDPNEIIEEVRAGVTGTCVKVQVEVEPDRRRAIALALGLAKPGDVVVVAGKGHETTQQFRGYATRFDDREVVREELAVLERRRAGEGRR